MRRILNQWLALDKHRNKTDQRLYWLAWLLRLPLHFFLIYSLLIDGTWNWRTIIGNVLAILISLLPRWMESRSRHHFPAVGELSIVLALVVEMFGRTFRLYDGSELPYDIFSHFDLQGTR